MAAIITIIIIFVIVFLLSTSIIIKRNWFQKQRTANAIYIIFSRAPIVQ